MTTKNSRRARKTHKHRHEDDEFDGEEKKKK